MDIESFNRRVYALDDSHPAKRFLAAFHQCRDDCVGRELGYIDEEPIDQQWESAVDGRVWTFSAFAYSFISLDIVLDGFLESAPYPTAGEVFEEKAILRYRLLLDECAQAAHRDQNEAILELVAQVQEMLDLWEQYLDYRKRTFVNVSRDDRGAIH